MLLCCGFFACYANGDIVKATKEQTKEELLFVMAAKDSKVKSNNGKVGELILYQVDKSVTYFTDRPMRKAGKMSMEAFLKLWDKGFEKDHPNSAFVYFEEDGKTVYTDIPVILDHPKYDKEHDRLTFDIKVLEEKQRLKTGHFGEVTLFVDIICAWME